MHLQIVGVFSFCLTIAAGTDRFRELCLALSTEYHDAAVDPIYFHNRCLVELTNQTGWEAAHSQCAALQHPELGRAHMLLANSGRFWQQFVKHYGANDRLYHNALLYSTAMWQYQLDEPSTGLPWMYPIQIVNDALEGSRVVQSSPAVDQWLLLTGGVLQFVAVERSLAAAAYNAWSLQAENAPTNISHTMCQWDDPQPSLAYRRVAYTRAAKYNPFGKTWLHTGVARSVDCSWLCARLRACVSYAYSPQNKLCLPQEVFYNASAAAGTYEEWSGFEWYDEIIP